MDEWNWAVVVAAVLGVGGTIGAQAVLARGEPGKLKTLRLLNEVLSKYDSEDAGKHELTSARVAYASKVAASYVTPRWWNKVAQSGLARALSAFVAGYAVFIGAVILLGGAERTDELWASVLPVGKIALIALAALSAITVALSMVWIFVEMWHSPTYQREIKHIKVRLRARRVAKLREPRDVESSPLSTG